MLSALKKNLRLWKLYARICRTGSNHLLTLFNAFCWPVLLVTLFGVQPVAAQEYSYVRYDVKDGLAGSTVYDLCQDKDGFMWFATEAGVSRFDGTHFKTFTTADGLPETEVIKLFADSKGRVWMAPFKNTICYYYKGKIHNQQNDSLLGCIDFKNVILDFFESKDSTIYFFPGEKIYEIKSKGSAVTGYTIIPVEQFINRYKKTYTYGIYFFENDSIFNWTGRGNELLLTLNKKDLVKNQINTSKQKLTSIYKTPHSNKVLFINSLDGAWMLDTLSPGNFKEIFLKGKPISHFFIDQEKNFWFSTLGEGVYKLVSREFQTFYFPGRKTAEIFSLEKIGNRIVAGSAFSLVYLLSGSRIDTVDFERYFEKSPHKFNANRLVFLEKTSDKTLVLGFDSFLGTWNTGKQKKKVIYISTIKSIDKVNDDSILVGTSSYALLLNTHNLLAGDTIWNNRTTAVCYNNNTYYIGTLDGLYLVNKDKTFSYTGTRFPPLRYRTGAFAKAPDGSVWVATYGGGVVCLKDNRVIHTITSSHGLTSNVCRALFLYDSVLWVGTDKGLNKVNLSNTSFSVTRYTISDGLPSHVINAIYVDSNRVYIGSPAGLTFFSELNQPSFSLCRLNILDISIANSSHKIEASYDLPYKNNSLKIAYAGISFSSIGDITYRYRLKGLYDTWDSTRQTSLEFPSLPSGDYIFELVAINKFGLESKPATISFHVNTPFWKTTWFQLGIIAAAILITWLLVTRRFKTIRKREREKAAIQQRMNELEQMALRAQMNPHFIFNCLNSIQNFVITHNIESTNLYLTQFAHLIRQTLDFSDKPFLTISEETGYLERYLELEKMRFGNSFDYLIEIDPRIDSDSTKIPGMLLQPYIENSIRHGLRHRNEVAGIVTIKFTLQQDELVCIIEDNGIGREKAQELKSRMHVEYQSKGMNLIAERVNNLNRQLVHPISIEVIDLTDSDKQPAGTRVVIHFPVHLQSKLN